MTPSILATWSAACARRRPTKPDTANALVETAEAFAEYRTKNGHRAEVVTLKVEVTSVPWGLEQVANPSPPSPGPSSRPTTPRS